MKIQNITLINKTKNYIYIIYKYIYRRERKKRKKM